ncbi:MAG: 2-hydroxymuconate tautomerase, partial [Rickettsiales bacterium]
QEPPMPILQVHLLEGRDLEKKRLLVKRLTEVVCETLGSKPEKVRVILSDMAHHDYSVAGVLYCDEEKK